MPHNEILTDQQAREELKAGIDLVANLVKKTLGPRGRNVVLDTNPFEPPTNTNDGVTIAREVHAPKNRPHQETGVKIAKNVANKTNDVAGDGTTTSLVLLQSVVTHAHKQINNDADPVSIARGIIAAGEAVAEELKNEATATTDAKSLIDVASISSSNRVIGKLVAETVHQVGADGVVTIEDSEVEETTARIAEGIELRGGVLLPAFFNDAVNQRTVVDKVPIFVTDHDFTNALEVSRMMEIVAINGSKKAVLIANSVTGEAMAHTFIMHAQGKFTLLPIKIQALGEQGQAVMRDMAAATGAKFFARDEGNRLPFNPQDGDDTFNIQDFGYAERVVATRDRTTIVDGGGETEKRVEELEAQLINSKKAFEKNMIKERIARLQRGVGVISVGGVTETERKERKLRVEDAINASKAALSSGIIAGGGAALYRASMKVKIPDTLSDDEKSGFLAVIRACREPINVMAENGSLTIDASKLVQLLKEKNSTIDFNTGEVVDAFKNGIIDPALVTISAVRNVASEAALNAITEGLVTRSEDDSEKL